MKKALTFGTVLLGCCLAAAAQTGSTPNQIPPTSTPPTFPQDQTGQTPANPSTPADPSALPPDTNAPGKMAHDQASETSSARPTSIEGCLSKSAEGNFILADSSGNSFQLRGLSSQLGDFVGKEIRVNGMADSTSAPVAGSMNAPSTTSSSASTSMASNSGASTSSAAGSAPATQFNVSDVKKVAESCPIAAAPSK